jgi:hypothetical protein
MRSAGRFCPDLRGPNRGHAELDSIRRGRGFLHRNSLLRQLQKQGRYRYLWWRKLARDTPRYAWRFLRRKLTRLLRRPTDRATAASSRPMSFR